jgi:hypothetical protein
MADEGVAAVEAADLAFVMAGHRPSKTGVDALMSGHPRLAFWSSERKVMDARDKPGHDEAGFMKLFMRKVRNDRMV